MTAYAILKFNQLVNALAKFGAAFFRSEIDSPIITGVFDSCDYDIDPRRRD